MVEAGQFERTFKSSFWCWGPWYHPDLCLNMNCTCVYTCVFSDAGAPVYMYEFQYHPSFSSDLKPGMVMGDHGDELFSVFGAPFTKGNSSLLAMCLEIGGLDSGLLWVSLRGFLLFDLRFMVHQNRAKLTWAVSSLSCFNGHERGQCLCPQHSLLESRCVTSPAGHCLRMRVPVVSHSQGLEKVGICINLKLSTKCLSICLYIFKMT